MLTRKGFLYSAASLAALGATPKIFAAKREMDKPELKLGVISDVHLRMTSDENILREVLLWYNYNLVDAVIVAGDMADYGLTWQMNVFKATWEDVFPGGRNTKGNKVELIYVTGNHEFEMWTHLEHIYKNAADLEGKVFVKDIEKEWPRLFGEPYQAVFSKVINGYTFLCCNFLGWNIKENAKAVASLFEREKDALASGKPVFYIQHCHPGGTCGYKPGKPDAITELLSKYPNVICFSGHSHEMLDAKSSFWRGKFTSVETSTLRTAWFSQEKIAAGSPKTQLWPQGLMVRVWPNYVHIEKRDFLNKCRFDPHWEVKL